MYRTNINKEKINKERKFSNEEICTRPHQLVYIRLKIDMALIIRLLNDDI